MGYYKSQERIDRFRITVEEHRTWVEHPDQEELKAPRSADAPKAVPTPRDKEEWQETDRLTTTSKVALAGLLRSKADELDPPRLG